MADFSFEDFLSWNEPNRDDPWNNPMPADTEDGNQPNWLSSILNAVAPLAQRFGAPAATVLGSQVNANRGQQAAQTAGQQQSQALNRGIDLQTAQWLQQQQNLAPYLEAGRGGLAQLQQLAQRQAPSFDDPLHAVSGANYALPGTTPGWQPEAYRGPQGPNAADYRWTPGQGPQAQDYRYTPGQTPDAGAYRWTPGQGPQAQDYRYTPGQTPDAAQYASGPAQLYRGAMPGTQVPTLTGQQVLDQDPGAAFRQTEARRALEGSAAARGGLLSGSTLQALQSRSQDLASQEYGQAYGRMMDRSREQYGRDWGQYQQQWNQGVTGAELGLRTTAQNFAQADAASRLREQVNQAASQQGWSQAHAESVFREQLAQQSSQQGFTQAEAASRLREQVNQVASQQGWSQAQAEATFREQLAQQSSQQGWNQALAGQQNAWTQGLEVDKWHQQQNQQYQQEMYNRQLEQSKYRYGQDVAQNQTDYDRANALYRQRMAAYMLPWEQQSTLATLGGNAVVQAGTQGQNATNAISQLLGRQGDAQAASTYTSALAQNTATNTTANSIASVLSNLNR